MRQRLRHVPVRLLGPVAAALALALTLGALELLVRLSGTQPPSLYQLDQDVCSTHIPELTAALVTPEFRTVVTFNQAGYRDYPRTRRKPPGTIRVALLGDSFVEALQVPLADTAGQVLERRLARELPERRVEVLNFGHAGFGTTCEYLTLRHRVLTYDPDLVVLMFYVGNDLYDNHPLLAAEPNAPFHIVRDDGSLALQPFAVRDSALERWLRAHSRLFLFVRDRIKRVAVLRRLGTGLGLIQSADGRGSAAAGIRTEHSVFRAPASAVVDQAWDVTDRLLALIADATRSTGGRLIVAVVPAREQVDETLAERARAAVPAGARTTIDFERPSVRLRALLAARGVPAIDLAQVFARAGIAPGELYYPVDGHWSAAGNRVAGEALATAIASLLANAPQRAGHGARDPNA